VYNGIRNLIADFIGMTLSDRFYKSVKMFQSIGKLSHIPEVNKNVSPAATMMITIERRGNKCQKGKRDD
jgi:hypothetical protein